MITQKTKAVVALIAALIIPVCFTAAGDPFSGVWRLDLSKSTLPPPVPKTQTARIKSSAESIQIREEIINSNGSSTEVSVTAKFDGKDYPVTGSPFADMVAYQRIDSHTIKGLARKGGKVVSREIAIVSKDGKTMTVTYTATDPAGKPITATAVFKKR